MSQYYRRNDGSIEACNFLSEVPKGTTPVWYVNDQFQETPPTPEDTVYVVEDVPDAADTPVLPAIPVPPTRKRGS